MAESTREILARSDLGRWFPVGLLVIRSCMEMRAPFFIAVATAGKSGYLEGGG
jgi:hypothetical protein